MRHGLTYVRRINTIYNHRSTLCQQCPISHEILMLYGEIIE